MSVYSFVDFDEIFSPVATNMDEEDCLEDGKLQRKNVTRPIYKRAFKATLSSSDVLNQLENAKAPDTKQFVGSKPAEKIVALKECKKDEPAAGKFRFRRVLQQSNSESFLDLRIRSTYRSPQAYLSIRKHSKRVPCYFNKLSDEIVLKIFQYLPKTSLVQCNKVCRRWSRLCKDDVLWKRLDLAGKRLGASAVHRLVNRGLKYLRLARADIRNDIIDFARVAKCQLKYLDLSMAVTDTPIVLRDILSRCTSLIGLSLESCDLAGDTEIFAAIGRNGELKLLNLALCKNITHTGVSYILNGCQKLTELNLAWTRLDQRAIRLACRMMPETLFRLNMSGCRDNTLLDDDVENLMTCCPALTELDLSDCTDITGRSLQLISENLPALQVLNFSRCYAVDPNSYINYCKELKELNVFGTLRVESLPVLERALAGVRVNQSLFSTISRPTVGIRRSSIWEHRTRD